MLVRIWTLVRKELIQFRRDWLMTAFILTLPVLQLMLLAQATSSRISDLCMAVVDYDRSPASRRLVTALDNRQELIACHFPETLADSHRLLDLGEAVLVVVIPDGFAADLADEVTEPHVQLISDASNSIAGSIALRSGNTAVLDFISDWSVERGLSAVVPVDLRTTVRYNSELNARLFSMPAQMGFIVYQVTLTVASIGLARERELGTLEQLMVVPLRRVEMVVGKAIPALLVGILNFVGMLAVNVHAYGIPMRGSLWLLLGLTVVFVLAEIGYGILISSIARTQQQAILLVFVLAMVDMTFSGYMVRIKNLPLALQIIGQIVPFSHYLIIVRGVMLKGAGLGVLWPHAAAMVAIGLAVLTVAVRSLSRSLD
jgi:ABC-2 type transport system permease protein